MGGPKGKASSYIFVKRMDTYPQEMNKEINRLNSFNSWPFQEDCLCTPQKMAEAGFYHCPNDNEPDLVRCYVCLKELDGWSPNDDPWKEHKRSKDCAFVVLGKKYNEMTVREYIKLESARHQNELRKKAKYIQEECQRMDDYVLEQLESMASM